MDHRELHELVTACDWFDWVAFRLNGGAVWAADERDDESAADLLNEAAIRVLAGARLLDRPLRADPPPQLWRPGQRQLWRP
jgi:hypothetical protein